MDKFQKPEIVSQHRCPDRGRSRMVGTGGLVEKGEKLVKEGKVKEALAAYREAQRLKPTWKLILILGIPCVGTGVCTGRRLR
jgi:hypothetical protein